MIYPVVYNLSDIFRWQGHAKLTQTTRFVPACNTQSVLIRLTMTKDCAQQHSVLTQSNSLMLGQIKIN